MYNGILVVNKEKGYTSHDVVAKLRGILKQKKIGHTGTLDPDAEGVLPVCLGNATKVCDLLTDRDKTYEAVLKLGIETDTQDMSGKILRVFGRKASGKEGTDTADVEGTGWGGTYGKLAGWESADGEPAGWGGTDAKYVGNREICKCVSKEKLLQAMEQFKGEYNQVPPMYSALKVNGKKLYEYARKGIEIERQARPVFINELVLLWWDEENMEAGIRVECSKGTYIRTLCHDIGKKLGCGGVMKSLLRTKAAGFSISQAHRLCDIEKMADTENEEREYGKIAELRVNAENERNDGDIGEWIIPTEYVFMEYPAFKAVSAGEKRLMNGNVLTMDMLVPLASIKDAKNKDLSDTGNIRIKALHGGEKINIKALSDTENTDMKIRVYDSKDEFKAVYELKSGEFYPVKMFL